MPDSSDARSPIRGRLVDRRTFLGLGAAASVVASAACRSDGFFRSGAGSAGDIHGSEIDAHSLRVLSRVAFGPNRSDADKIARSGVDGFIDEQLDADSLADTSAWWRIRRVESLALPVEDLYALTDDEALADLRCGTILRAVYSERQLLERMVELWSDRFNVYGGKADCGRFLLVYDRDVIRANALGNYRDLLYAVTTSPAMLVYLDGRSNEASHPNENHARELLELHTLGVDGGYTQTDVMEAARALSGWRIRQHWRPGDPAFDSERHDDGAKRILGTPFEAGRGRRDVEDLVECLIRHSATARRVALAICRQFVGESPSPRLVDRIARIFMSTEGDIRSMVREVLHSNEFRNSAPMVERPFGFAVKALRLLGADTDGGADVQVAMRALGHLPFDWPTPDGYPSGESHWRSLVPARWRFAFALASNSIAGTNIGALSNVESIARSALGRSLDERERLAMETVDGDVEQIALLLASPAFQLK